MERAILIEDEKALIKILGPKLAESVANSPKGIGRLWQEIQEKDAYLAYDENNAICRHVKVGSGIIQYEMHPDLVLLEVNQIFKHGNEKSRQRNIFPAGKIQLGECPVKGFLREMVEELDLIGDAYEPELLLVEKSNRPSPSYGNLKSYYETYYYRLWLHGEDIHDSYSEDNTNHTLEFDWRSLTSIEHKLSSELKAKLELN